MKTHKQKHNRVVHTVKSSIPIADSLYGVVPRKPGPPADLNKLRAEFEAAGGRVSKECSNVNQRENDFAFIDEIQRKFDDVPIEIHEREVRRAVKEARARLRLKGKKAQKLEKSVKNDR